VTDTLWSDISEFQVPVSDAYPYRFLCLRSNDGSYQDHHFTQNIAWARAAVKTGRLWGFMVYYFYRPGVNGAQVLMGRVGKPDPQMTVMIDVESDSGRVSGNQSAAVNAQHDELARWLGSPKRVTGYGNVSDLNALWPSKPPGLRIVVAAYGSNPGYPGKFAHQFTDSAHTAPFGPSDLNSADGMSQADLQDMFGLAPPQPSGPVRHVVPKGNTQTMRGMLAPRNWSVAAFLVFNKCLVPAHLNPANYAVLETLAAADAAATDPDSGAVGGYPMRPGTVYYTEH
jgi:hypothetical protein